MGVVSDRLWPLIPLAPSGVTGTFWALVDTGFEGHLMVPESERARLRVVRSPILARGTNADGSENLMTVGRTTLDWFGSPLAVNTLVAGTTTVEGVMHDGDPIVGIVGLYLLQSLRVTADLYPGYPVTIERIT